MSKEPEELQSFLTRYEQGKVSNDKLELIIKVTSDWKQLQKIYDRVRLVKDSLHHKQQTRRPD